MANLRAIRTRIRSVENTQQITKSMKMVAGAKLRRTQSAFSSLRDYAARCAEMLGRVAQGMPVTEPLLLPHAENARVCYVLIVGNRGLCGTYNSALLRYLEELAEKEEREKFLVVCGRWGKDMIPGANIPIRESFEIGDAPDAKEAEELTAYLQVWFKEFFQHPVCYLEATWNQCYTLFMPEADNPVFNQDAIYGSDIFEDPTENMASKIGVSIPTPLEGVAEWLCSFYKLQATLPLTGRLNNVAVHIMLLFFLSMFLRTQWKAQKKPARHVALTGFLPFWLIFIFVILGPQVSMQPRYSFPIIYGIPLLMSYCITAVSSNSVSITTSVR